MKTTTWPKTFPPLSADQEKIRDDFMKHWHEVLASQRQFGLIEKFNHCYPIKQSNKNFINTLEVGAGLGEHLSYEKLNPTQQKNYVALEMRRNMFEEIKNKYPAISTYHGDCQSKLSLEDNTFDRILAIHVLEHLPNLPQAVKEMYRLCNKVKGQFIIVIPCEGGFAYSLARKVSAQRIFERRYKQSYKWFIEREHINTPSEILTELAPYFDTTHKQYFPFRIPSIHLNLCIGVSLTPKILHKS